MKVADILAELKRRQQEQPCTTLQSMIDWIEAQRPTRKKYLNQYYEDHKEELKEYARKYHHDHKEQRAREHQKRKVEKFKKGKK